MGSIIQPGHIPFILTMSENLYIVHLPIGNHSRILDLTSFDLDCDLVSLANKKYVLAKLHIEIGSLNSYYPVMADLENKRSCLFMTR